MFSMLNGPPLNISGCYGFRTRQIFLFFSNDRKLVFPLFSSSFRAPLNCVLKVEVYGASIYKGVGKRRCVRLLLLLNAS